MFEEVISKEMIEVVNELQPHLSEFYLAGGTGLALQLRHRRSIDLDFFSFKGFEAEELLRKIKPDKLLIVRTDTIHCEKSSVKLSFIYYSIPLIYKPAIWRGLQVADWRDITAEKMKAISQRCSKKDFYDLFAVIKLKAEISSVCNDFKKKFSSTQINLYHVLKSLVFFDDADSEPMPNILISDEAWRWENVKSFFTMNVHQFEMELFK
ncbi:MAG: nucleotidyl transferase AbiEii/AbiGii toxin family protein [Bacteroidota bacterium]|nr:nucleotidyl transferase AbiEii/AbiGii toxin family protein [Bacteroidota bacterium]